VISELLKCDDYFTYLDLVSTQKKRKSKVTMNGSKDLKNEQTKKAK